MICKIIIKSVLCRDCLFVNESESYSNRQGNNKKKSRLFSFPTFSIDQPTRVRTCKQQRSLVRVLRGQTIECHLSIFRSTARQHIYVTLTIFSVFSPTKVVACLIVAQTFFLDDMNKQETMRKYFGAMIDFDIRNKQVQLEILLLCKVSEDKRTSERWAAFDRLRQNFNNCLDC